MKSKRRNNSPPFHNSHPQPHHEEETRDAILTAARDLIQRYGFRKTTMDDIARAMGKQRSSLYYYFSGKEEVVGALVEKELMEISRAVRDEVAGQPDAASRLRIYMIARLQQVALRSTLFSQIRSEIQGGGTTDVFRLSEQRQAFDKEEERYFAGIVLHGIRDGQFRPLSREAVTIFTHFAFSAMRGIELELFLDPNRATDLKPRLEVAFDIFLRGLLQ